MVKAQKYELNRNYSYHLGFFTAFLVATLLFAFNFMERLILGWTEITIIEFILNFTILLSLVILFIASKNSLEDVSRE